MNFLMIRLLLPLLIMAGIGYLIVKLTSRARYRKHHNEPQPYRKHELEDQLERAMEDLTDYEKIAHGQCPYCESAIAPNAIKCPNCDQSFWMTHDEAIRNTEATRARIDTLQQMIRNLD